MDLINPTGEKLEQMFDGYVYEFPPNEVVHVADEAGLFLLAKQAQRGLVEIRWGDDPAKLSFAALEAVIAFHRRQVEAHETQKRVAEETRHPLPAEPEGYKRAKAALAAYEPLYVEREKAREIAEAKKLQDEIKAAMVNDPQVVPLEDRSIEELRAIVRRLDGDPGKAMSAKKLIGMIHDLQAEKDEAQAEADRKTAAKGEEG